MHDHSFSIFVLLLLLVDVTKYKSWQQVWADAVQRPHQYHLNNMRFLAESVVQRDARAYGFGTGRSLQSFRQAVAAYREEVNDKQGVWTDRILPALKQLFPVDTNKDFPGGTQPSEEPNEDELLMYEELIKSNLPNGLDESTWVDSRVGIPPRSLWALIDEVDPANTIDYSSCHDVFSLNQAAIRQRFKETSELQFDLSPYYHQSNSNEQLLVEMEAFLVPRWVVDKFVIELGKVFKQCADNSFLPPDQLDRAAIRRLLATVHHCEIQPWEDSSRESVLSRMSKRREKKRNGGILYTLRMLQGVDEYKVFSPSRWIDVIKNAIVFYRDAVFFRVTSHHYSYNSVYAIDSHNRHGLITENLLNELERTRNLYTDIADGARLRDQGCSMCCWCFTPVQSSCCTNEMRSRELNFRTFHKRREDAAGLFHAGHDFTSAVTQLSDDLKARGDKLVNNANNRNAYVGLLNAVAAIILGLVGGEALGDLGYGDQTGQFTEWRLFIVSCVASASFLIMTSLGFTHDGYLRTQIIQTTQNLVESGQFSEHSSPIGRWEKNPMNIFWNKISALCLFLAFAGLMVAMFAKVFDCYFKYEGLSSSGTSNSSGTNTSDTSVVTAQMNTPTFILTVGALGLGTFFSFVMWYTRERIHKRLCRVVLLLIHIIFPKMFFNRAQKNIFEKMLTVGKEYTFMN